MLPRIFDQIIEGVEAWEWKMCSVSFFPELPHYKSWQELPNSVQEWDFKIPRAPVSDSVDDICPISFGFPHDYRNLILDHIVVGALIKYVLHCFFLLLA
jgi:hypothetical protein